jgi:hypothetical protein
MGPQTPNSKPTPPTRTNTRTWFLTRHRLPHPAPRTRTGCDNCTSTRGAPVALALPTAQGQLPVGVGVWRTACDARSHPRVLLAAARLQEERRAPGSSWSAVIGIAGTSIAASSSVIGRLSSVCLALLCCNTSIAIQPVDMSAFEE